jgi:hypothetical protein
MKSNRKNRKRMNLRLRTERTKLFKFQDKLFKSGYNEHEVKSRMDLEIKFGHYPAIQLLSTKLQFAKNDIIKLKHTRYSEAFGRRQTLKELSKRYYKMIVKIQTTEINHLVMLMKELKLQKVI